MALLAKFLSVREPNLKYLALENMARLAEVPAVVDTGARAGLLGVAVLRAAGRLYCSARSLPPCIVP